VTSSVVLGPRPGRAWIPVSRALYRRRDGDELEAWRLVLPPSGRFTHLTAAGIHGLWLPPLPLSLPVFAAISGNDARPQRGNLRVARHADPGPILERRGLPVDTVPATLLACARDLELLDVIVLVDSALQLRLTSQRAIADLAEQRRRGAPLLRRALALSDGRSESPYETLLRLLHVTCGIHVEPQNVVSDDDGSFVARGDLWLCGTHTLHEYDGADHLKVPQQQKDLRRLRHVTNARWTRRGYTSNEVLHQAVTILRDADLAVGRLHRPERVRPWHSLLAASLFTAGGRRRLQNRLSLPET
jgi:hypothetical protein